MNAFKEMLILFREKNNLSPTQMARRVGIPRSTLIQFEQRRNGVKGATLAKLLCWALTDVSTHRHR